MKFTVTYRGADGSMREECVEAVNRPECFAAMKARGIVPIRVMEGAPKGGGRKSSGKTGGAPVQGGSRNGHDARPRRRRTVLPYVLFVLASVALLGGGIWWWLGRDEARPSDEPDAPKKSSLAKEVKPAAAPAPAPAVTNVAPEREMTLEERYFAETNGMSKGQLKIWKFKHYQGPVVTNGRHRVLSLAEKTFRHGAEVHIAGLLTLEPGAPLLGDSKLIYNKNFVKSFLKSLEEPIIAEEGDSDEVKSLKKAVTETKIELKQRMDAGEDICKIMADTREDLQKLGLYREELKKQMLELGKDGKYTEADMEDFVKAANQMLSERGAKPITMPHVLKYRFNKMKQQNNGGEKK